MEQNMSLNEKTIQMIEFRIIDAEKKNAKTHEKKDNEMVKTLVDIIKSEVDREQN